MTSLSKRKPAPREAVGLINRIQALFSADYYVAQYPDVDLQAMDPLAHFMSVGRFEGRNPTPLFDSLHYAKQVRVAPPKGDLISHYISFGDAAGLSPHPLFDPAWYLAEMGTGRPVITLLEHYLSIGWRNHLAPHPLFDPEYYALIAGLPKGVVDPVSHYLMQVEYDFAPHYLFSDALYIAEIEAKMGTNHQHAYRGDAPLLHYLRFGHVHEPQVHPLFDPADYRANIQKYFARHPTPDAERQFERSKDLLCHYLTEGVRLGVSPSPYFDPAFYRSQFESEIFGDPVRHYLMPGGYTVASPHPGIDLTHYAEHSSSLVHDTPSILHLLSRSKEGLTSPHPAFDIEHYNSTYTDIGQRGLSPVLHFLAHGMAEDRLPNPWFSPDYVFASNPTCDFSHQSAAHRYFSQGKQSRLRLVFVSHDAGLTGAPGTALRLVEDFSKYSNVECFAIIAQDGPRIPDFQKAAHTFIVHTPFYATPKSQLNGIVQRLLALTNGNEPIAAVVNSTESRAMGEALAAAGIPVVTLVHEAADLYPDGEFDTVIKSSRRIVFGSNFVLDRANLVSEMPAAMATVRGQGLQQDYIGSLNKKSARAAILKELNLPDTVFLVLGCGSIDYRKGADLFVATAIDFLERAPADQLTCFVWVGQGQPGVLRSFVTSAVKSHGRSCEIRFIGGRTDVEPYFLAADVFLMTSRIDPFPCVCQEAMASGLPIVAFTEGGGTVELIGEDCGFCVPLGDTAAMADCLLGLASDPDLRRAIGQMAIRKVREKWRPQDYSAFIAETLSEISGVELDAFGTLPKPCDESDQRVFLLFDAWRQTAFHWQAEALVLALNKRGYKAEILLTQGRFSCAGAIASVPNVPFRFLQPSNVMYHDGRWRTTPESIWRGLQQFGRQQQPAVFIAMQDKLAAALAPLLSSRIGVVGVINTSDPGDVDDGYAYGPYLDGIVALSNFAAAALIEKNPALVSKVKIMPLSTPAVQPGSNRRSRAARDKIYLHVTAADSQTASNILGLRRLLHTSGSPVRLVLHAEEIKGGHTLSTFLAASGLASEDLLLASGWDEVSTLLNRSAFAVFLDAGPSTQSGLVHAISCGALPILFDLPATIERVFGSLDTLHNVRSGIAALARILRDLLVDTPRRDACLGRLRLALKEMAVDADACAAQYSALLTELFAELSGDGSQRVLDFSGAAFDTKRTGGPIRYARLGGDQLLPPPN